MLDDINNDKSKKDNPDSSEMGRISDVNDYRNLIFNPHYIKKDLQDQRSGARRDESETLGLGQPLPGADIVNIPGQSDEGRDTVFSLVNPGGKGASAAMPPSNASGAKVAIPEVIINNPARGRVTPHSKCCCYIL